MFKSIKKRRLQERENCSVNSENICENSASIFPSANDILETSKQKWREVTPEEILEKVKAESSKGNRRVTMYDFYISDQLVKELRKMGYRIEVHPMPASIGPYFEIYW